MIFMNVLDSFPHLGFVFQMLVIISIGIVFAQIKLAGTVDHLRHGINGNKVMFQLRKAAMFMKLLALIWTVVYSYERNWQPWPPIIMFLLAFDMYVIAEIVVLRSDIARFRRLQSLGPRSGSRTGG